MANRGSKVKVGLRSRTKCTKSTKCTNTRLMAARCAEGMGRAEVGRKERAGGTIAC